MPAREWRPRSDPPADQSWRPLRPASFQNLAFIRLLVWDVSIRAFFFAIAASLFFAGSTFTSKLLGSGYFGDPAHSLQITHSRFPFGLVTALVLFLVMHRRLTIIGANLHLHALRSTLSWIGVGIMFAGVIYIPASDDVALTFLNPIFAMIFARFLLKERVDWQRWRAAGLSFVRTLGLLRPEGGIHPVALACIFERWFLAWGLSSSSFCRHGRMCFRSWS